MKTKEFKSIKIKEIKELKNLVSKKKLELIKNQVKMLSGKEKNLKKIWALKKEIAQLLTVIKEKEFLEKK
ncbi:MAG: 50S ribosomal protein L29 [Candidatus Woesebacteria bacterium]|nr:50S ribosomal protein L29 [Candidatus Woesebacteria bacterium]